MPWMPSALSASFTSWSLKGLMMASIFFIVRALFVVGALAVLRNIQADTLVFLINPQADDGIDNFQNDECANPSQSHGKHDCLQLIHELPEAAGKRNRRAVNLEGGGNGAVYIRARQKAHH